MIKRLLLCVLASSVAFSSGCTFFRKGRKPKESNAIATETEKEFQQRWIAHRVADLNAQGVSGEAAQQQAEHEFQEKYSFAVPRK